MKFKTTEMQAFLFFLFLAATLWALSWVGLTNASPNVAAVLLREQPEWSERTEPKEERERRIAEIAEAISAVSNNKWEKAMLMSIGWNESRFSRKACDGHLTGDHGRAYGCWQSWDKDRSGGYLGQADRAIRHLRAGYRHCGNWEGAVSIYATGSRCNWTGAQSRLMVAEKFYRRL